MVFKYTLNSVNVFWFGLFFTVTAEIVECSFKFTFAANILM